jgi:hypothetical protein
MKAQQEIRKSSELERKGKVIESQPEIYDPFGRYQEKKI